MKKRILSMLIAMVMILMALPVLTIPAIAEPNGETRYTVLVLDTSGKADFYGGWFGGLIYSADPAFDYVTQAAKAFCRSILNASGTNNVAIVQYRDDATIVSNFTTNLSTLESRIDSLDPPDTSESSGRSVAEALKTAEQLIDGVTTPNAIKNVVIFGTGMTNVGDYNYEGRYSSSTIGSDWHNMATNIHLYAYSNVAYEIASRIKGKATLYSIGLFQIFDDMPSQGRNIAEFFRMFAEDIASTGHFYPVNDPNDLEFVFGDVADDITGSLSLRNLKYWDCVLDEEGNIDVHWGGLLFNGDSQTIDSFNQERQSHHRNLATISAVLSRNAYDRERLNSTLNELDAINIKPFHGGTHSNPEHFIAHAVMNIGGVDSNVVFVITRGTQGSFWDSDSDWSTNRAALTNENKEHRGFAQARDTVMDNLNTYLSDNNIPTANSKILITGHSYGGAVSNLLAKSLENNPMQENSFSKNNIYCYTFGLPNTIVVQRGVSVDALRSANNNIHNYRNEWDPVVRMPAAPLRSETYTIHGKQHYFSLGRVGIGVRVNRNHNMTHYLNHVAGLAASTPIETSHIRRIFIRCPVDVVAFDREGNIIGSITENNLDENVTSIFMFPVDDEKHIMIPADESISLLLTATDTGFMSFGLHDYDAVTDELFAWKEFNNVVLESGKRFKVIVNSEVEIRDIRLFVIDENDMEIAEVLEDGTEHSLLEQPVISPQTPNDANPPTGVVFVILPMLLSGGVVLLTKKRRK
jgi:hypothetical protein